MDEIHFIRLTQKSRPRTGSRDPTHAYRGQFVIQKLMLDIFNLHTKFDDSSFSHSRETLAIQKYKMGNMT